MRDLNSIQIHKLNSAFILLMFLSNDGAHFHWLLPKQQFYIQSFEIFGNRHIIAVFKKKNRRPIVVLRIISSVLYQSLATLKC
jgi:hypothetical protein